MISFLLKQMTGISTMVSNVAKIELNPFHVFAVDCIFISKIINIMLQQYLAEQFESSTYDRGLASIGPARDEIFYSAIDQVIPGPKGGSVHVAAIAEGLAALGHDVTALVTLARPAYTPSTTGVRWIGMTPPLGSTHLRMMRASRIARVAAGMRPDIVMERYHNFGGEALTRARRRRDRRARGERAGRGPSGLAEGARGSRPPDAADAALARTAREMADLIITPSAAILPPGTPRDRIRLVEWGADTDRFHPGAAGPLPFVRPSRGDGCGVRRRVSQLARCDQSGAQHKTLHADGCRDRGGLIGEGPELARVRAEAAGIRDIVFTGAVPHEAMPAALSAADIGVAPFDPSAHAPLSLGFYWSPLKIFEYMAAGLPVVAPSIERIRTLVDHGREGLFTIRTTRRRWRMSCAR